MNNELQPDWAKTVLDPTATIADAVQVLNDASLRLVLVLDQQKKILGTVTDGDVRRGLIQQLGMSAPVSAIMNRKPVTVNSRMGRNSMIQLMREKDILQLPVVKSDGTVVGVEFLQSLTVRPTVQNVAVLMAGGFGRRLQPLTETTPKPMLKVGSKPILEIIVDQLADSGFRKIYISVFYKAGLVQEYFGRGEKWGVEIDYLVEESPLGTAGALSLLPDDIGAYPVLVMNGDILTRVDFSKLIKFHEEQRCGLTVGVREYDFQVPYGVISVEENRILEIAEKPVHTFFVNAGIYVVDQGLIDRINRHSRRDMTEVIEKQLSSNQSVNAFPIHEYWMDIGMIEQYEQANWDIRNEAND
jgi:dTDP-glucose pyrophosphorylase